MNIAAVVGALLIGVVQNDAFSQIPSLPNMPYPRIGMCYARFGHKVFFIGGATQRAQNLQGFDAFEGTNVVESFDFNTLTWDTNVAPLNTPRVFACAVTIGDSIYVMGGVDDSGNVVGSVEVYDSTTNSWHYGVSMLHERKGAAAIAIDDNIYVFGGGGPLSVLRKDVEKFSVEDQEWTETDPMTYPRAYEKVYYAHGHVYIFGGISDVYSVIGPNGIIEKYNPDEGPVQVALSLHTPRTLFDIAAKGDSVFVISGLGVASVESRIELLNLHDDGDEEDTEMDSTLLDSPRVGFCSLVGRDGRIYLFGGSSPTYKSGQAAVATVSYIPGLSFITGATNVVQQLPTSFSLSQNYPNPFNPSTTINYEVPSGGARLEISVFNILGQRVAVLVDGYETGGKHSIPFNGANIASGSYIYRMTTENGITYRKMVLVK